MSVNPLLTNYNAIGGSLFAPASGGSGPGGGNITVASLTVTQEATTPNSQITINKNQTTGSSSIAFQDLLSTILVIATDPNDNTAIANGGFGSYGGGQLSFVNWSSINMLGDGVPYSTTTLSVDSVQSQTLAALNLNISTINGSAPGVAGVSQIIAGSNVTISPAGGTGAVTINASGGGSNAPDQSFSTITLATGGSIFGAAANLNISSINGAAPSGGGGPTSYVSTINSSASVIATTSGTGAKTVTLALNDFVPAYPPLTAPPVGTFGANVASSSALIVLDPALGGAFDLAFFGQGYFYISIPLTLQTAQNPAGTPVATAVTPGTVIQHAIQIGDVSQTTTTVLQSVPIIGNASNSVFANGIPINISGIFYCPSALPTIFKLLAWAPVPTGGVGDSGFWAYNTPSDAAGQPVAYVQRLG